MNRLSCEVRKERGRIALPIALPTPIVIVIVVVVVVINQCLPGASNPIVVHYLDFDWRKLDRLDCRGLDWRRPDWLGCRRLVLNVDDWTVVGWTVDWTVVFLTVDGWIVNLWIVDLLTVDD